jgi:hypothetical protein
MESTGRNVKTYGGWNTGKSQRLFLSNLVYAANSSVGSTNPTVDLTYSTGDISAALDLRLTAAVAPSSISAGISVGVISKPRQVPYSENVNAGSLPLRYASHVSLILISSVAPGTDGLWGTSTPYPMLNVRESFPLVIR